MTHAVRLHGRAILRAAGSGLLCLLWVSLGLLPLVEPFPVPWAALWIVATVGAFLWLHPLRGRGYARRRRMARARVRRPGPGAGRVIAASTMLLGAEFGFAVLMLSMGVESNDASQIFTDYLARPWGWIPVLLGIVILAPVVEETGFRGWMQRRLEHAWGVVPAIVVTAALFSLAHGEAGGFLSRFAFGLCAGFVAFRTGSIWLSVLFHAISNLWIGLLLILTPSVEDATLLRWIGAHGGNPALLALILLSLAATGWILRDLPALRRGPATPARGDAAGAGAAITLPFGSPAAPR